MEYNKPVKARFWHWLEPFGGNRGGNRDDTRVPVLKRKGDREGADKWAREGPEFRA